MIYLNFSLNHGHCGLTFTNSYLCSMVHSSITIIADEDIKDDTSELLEILHILSMLIFNGTLNVVCTVLADLNMRDALADAPLAKV